MAGIEHPGRDLEAKRERRGSWPCRHLVFEENDTGVRRDCGAGWHDKGGLASFLGHQRLGVWQDPAQQLGGGRRKGDAKAGEQDRSLAWSSRCRQRELAHKHDLGRLVAGPGPLGVDNLVNCQRQDRRRLTVGRPSRVGVEADLSVARLEPERAPRRGVVVTIAIWRSRLGLIR